MTALMLLSVLVVGFVLVLVLATVVAKGWSIVAGSFPAWFTKDIQLRPRVAGPGMKAAIIGTLVITLTATVIAVPLGIGGAIYLNEYGRTHLFARILRFLTNVMAGVPSIVMGLFIYVFWVVPRGTDGLNGSAGALALACLMLADRGAILGGDAAPRAAEPARRQLRPWGPARAARRLRVVLPKASPGIISGCLLAVARAAGETAPLIFTIGAAKSHQLERLQRHEHVAVDADLRERQGELRHRPAASLGSRLHTDPRGVPVHGPRPGTVVSLVEDEVSR